MATRPDSESDPRIFRRSFRAIEYLFSVATDIPDLLPDIKRLLGRLAAEPVEGGTEYGLWHGSRRKTVQTLNGQRITDSTNPLRLLQGIVWDAQQEAIRGARELLVVHGAAAARGDDVVLLPAPMDSGKSTLVTALVRAGLDYVTDEAILIDPASAMIRPFLKPVRLETHSLSLLGGLQSFGPRASFDTSLGFAYFDADEIRQESTSRGGRTRFVVSLELRPGNETRLHPISQAAGLMALARNVFDFPTFGSEGLTILRRVVQTATCFRLEVGDLASATAVVSSLMGE